MSPPGPRTHRANGPSGETTVRVMPRGHPRPAVSALLLMMSCVSGAGCEPEAPDPRIAAADRVLSPTWREGMTWSLEVHGSIWMDKWPVSFWGISHFVVESTDPRRAEVSGRFHPVVFRSYEDPTCTSRLHFELQPWRLIRVELVDAAGARVPPPPERDTRAAISPCLPAVPRHPLARAGVTTEGWNAQRIHLGDGIVLFTSHLGRYHQEPLFGVTRWRHGMPWWSAHETTDARGLSVFGREPARRTPGRRRDRLFVERARLIAVDGEAILPAPWGVASPSSATRWYPTWLDDPTGLSPDGLVVQAP